jgi:putative addiction module component (TIGR02574 family)
MLYQNDAPSSLAPLRNSGHLIAICSLTFLDLFEDPTIMTTATQEIAGKALSLSPEDRASIAQMLIQSLESSQSYEEEWLETVEKRHQEINSGKVKPISWDEVKSFITEE